MKKPLLFILISFISLTVLSQSCLPDGVVFTTQEQIDNFQIDNPNCTEIEGDVTINGENITNLNGLNVLISIEGGLFIGENDSLISLTGLDNMTTVGGTLRIYMNPVLNSLTGLDNISSIGGNLRITSNAALTGLTGLDNVTSIGGNLRIYMNAALTSLAGLDNVTVIGDNLRISSNDALTSLTALNNLTSIGGELGVTENDALTSLSGLDSINAGTITELSIYNNISLSTCEVQSVCNYLASPSGAIDIHDNATGCNNQEEVEGACFSFIGSIEGSYSISISPNPFSTTTTIEYELKQPESVSLTIYDYLGKQVYHVQENQSQGKQQLIWNAENFADGIYYYRLQAGDQVANGKLVKVR